jgi:gas vesicle protein
VTEENCSDPCQMPIFVDFENILLRRFVYIQTDLYFKQNFLKRRKNSFMFLIKVIVKIEVMSKGKVLLGVLSGVAIGATLGVLFAPDKGWNTRKRISKKAEDLSEDLKEKFDEFLDNISVKVDKVKEEAADIAEKTRARTGEAKKDAKTATA